jgi:hypothetical protein
MKMGKQVILALCTIAVGTGAWSLTIYDPNDRIYTYLSAWDEKGYYDPLPMLRPYPPQLVRSCLEQVAKRGNDVDRAIAGEYLSALDGEGALLAFKPVDDSLLHVGVDFSGEEFVNTAAADTFFRPGGELSLSGKLGPAVQFSGMTGLWLWDKYESNFIPYRTEESIFYSNGGGASLTLGGTTYNLPSLWKGGLFIGSGNLFFQAGLMRSSFGPFFDTSAVLGPQAPEAGHFSFTWQGGWFSLSSVLLELNASVAVNPASPLGQDILYSLSGGATGFFPSKYLILHSAQVQPFPWISLGIIQSTVFGARLDPLYLIPFGVLADSQIFSGDWDNSLMGLYGRIRLPWNLTADLSLYVDDLNSNQAIQLNFNSGQDKLALHGGLLWTPELPVLLRLSAEYLILTPWKRPGSRFGPAHSEGAVSALAERLQSAFPQGAAGRHAALPLRTSRTVCSTYARCA